MAKAIVTFTDTDLDAGKVSVDINVIDSITDDGSMTMAHVFAKFIQHKMNDAAFLGQVYEFAEDLIVQEPASVPVLTKAACAA